MSTGMNNIYLIKKTDICKYLYKNKTLISEMLDNCTEPIQNLYPLSEIINFWYSKGYDFSSIARMIFKGNIGVQTYLEAKNRKENADSDFERYLDSQFNVFNFDIWITVLDIGFNNYMIVQDRFNLLKNLYLADLSYNTSTDLWVSPFMEAIKKYHLVSLLKDRYRTANKLVEIIEKNNDCFPKNKIELYSHNRFENFISRGVIFRMILKEVADVVLNPDNI